MPNVKSAKPPMFNSKGSVKPHNLVAFLVALLLTACSPTGPTPVGTDIETIPATEMPIVTPVQCLSTFQRRELREPYQRNKYTNEARYTLSTEELNAYLSIMGIQSLCIPAMWGAPFVNADWDSATQPSVEGRMISLGFENLYPGAGWSKGFLLYSTYGFGAPTEYETFATLADRDAVREGTGPDLIEVNGVTGLMRIKASDLCMGACSVYRTFVFPFETYYVAVVYDLGAFDYDNTDWESLLQDFRAGKYQPEQQADVAAMDYLVSTLHFQSLTDQ